MTENTVTVVLGLGSNLPAPDGATPANNIVGAFRALEVAGIKLTAKSSVYETEPVPPSDQPWYANAVAVGETTLSPDDLLAVLQDTEAEFGRVRRTKWESRILDLDILDYGGRIQTGETLSLPHPHMHQRRFVLEPLCEIAPEWGHPVRGLSAAELLADLDDGGAVVRR